MRRRIVLAGLGAGILAPRRNGAEAQPSRKKTVGVAGGEVPLFEAFVAGLRELGLEAGRGHRGHTCSQSEFGCD